MSYTIREITLENKEKRYELYINVRGKQVRKRQKKKRAAEQMAKQIHLELSKGIGKSKNYTWESWFQHFIEMIRVTHRPSTVLGYEKALWKHSKIWMHKFVSEITPFDVRHLIDNAAVSPVSRKNILKMLRVVFHAAIAEDVIQKNPCTGITVKVPESIKTILNREEINTLLREANRRNHPWYEIWAVALMTGCRTGELYALRWTDIDFLTEKISINKSWNIQNGEGSTKNCKNRIIPINKALKELLARMKLKNTGEYVLPRIEEWTKGQQANILRKFCAEIGITSVKFHDLRACFITSMLLAGVSVPQVMKIVGHADLETTMEYVRLVSADLNGTTDKLTFVLPHEISCNVISMLDYQK